MQWIYLTIFLIIYYTRLCKDFVELRKVKTLICGVCLSIETN